ncbi:uncharacterized protein LOC127876414 isoform X2 [Dreissena polymorpha]|uniref:uncharacterized protein LOC127876414 isoform X2 n=1 Tax=Dreissena polymorpha TaxID=45954 RepID=UPI002264B6BB|nr:uncharacterized protein LOC127876414 isoform X2 [Dreissena polymorpha]
MCSNIDPMVCMENATSDPSEHGTCVQHNEMEVDSTEQAEHVPKNLSVEDKLTQELNLAKEMLKEKMNELASEKNAYLRLEHESNIKYSQLQEEKEACEARYTQARQAASNYYAALEEQKQIIEIASSTEERLQRIIDQDTHDMKALVAKIVQLQEQIHSTEDKYATAVQEKDDLTIRLSKLASASLTHNNPNIADLSDPNRPTKLAEAFSELYDNEWTDAFETLKDDDEVKRVKSLSTMLQKAYGLSVSLSKEALIDIKGTSAKIVFNIKTQHHEREHSGFVSGSNSSEQNNVNSNDSNSLTINSLNDNTPVLQTEHFENAIRVETITSHVSAMESYDRENRMTASQQNLLKENTHHDNVTEKHQENESKNDAQHTTIPICEVDEQLHVHATHKLLELSECSSEIDTVKKNESEMEIATVDFDFEQLQPTEKQLISDIRKRIFNDIKDQIIFMISDAVVAGMNLRACENSIFTYVKACASICWQMRIHQPPVCIDFVEVDDQTPFNTASYKHYTKSGPRIEYVVWPALYLHEGGPLLSKGVAQGK